MISKEMWHALKIMQGCTVIVSLESQLIQLSLFQ